MCIYVMQIKNTIKISEKHILIIGNRSYKNLGDELILLWTIKLLLKQKKQITIAAYDTKRLKKFFHQFIDTDNITFVTEIPKWFRTRVKYIREGKRKERKLRKQADAVIIGGWEIITPENKHSYRYRLASLLPILKKPRYLMGWIQLPKNYFNRFLFNILLKNTKHIFARDTQTIHELKTYGFDNVDFFMDTSYFAYKRDSFHRFNVSTFQRSEKYIVINLNKNAEKFLPEIIQDVKKYYKQWYKIIFIPIAKGSGTQYNDYQYARKIQRRADIKDQRFSILDREQDFKHFTKILAWASIVISTRLHLFLIASFLWVETKVYPYQKKILKMQQTLNSLKL